MNRVYEPRWGTPAAHQIGMSTRIVYFFCLLISNSGISKNMKLETWYILDSWLGLTLVFEWAGSIAIARPVQEILVGWNIAQGYMWYFVLMTYLTSNLLLGIVFYPGKEIE